jgi:hypothetical protein
VWSHLQPKPRHPPSATNPRPKLDLAHIGGKAGPATHGARIAPPGRRPKQLADGICCVPCRERLENIGKRARAGPEGVGVLHLPRGRAVECAAGGGVRDRDRLVPRGEPGPAPNAARSTVTLAANTPAAAANIQIQGQNVPKGSGYLPEIGRKYNPQLATASDAVARPPDLITPIASNIGTKLIAPLNKPGQDGPECKSERYAKPRY